MDLPDGDLRSHLNRRASSSGEAHADDGPRVGLEVEDKADANLAGDAGLRRGRVGARIQSQSAQAISITAVVRRQLRLPDAPGPSTDEGNFDTLPLRAGKAPSFGALPWDCRPQTTP